MRRCPHRINFRLTTAQHEKFGQMIGKLMYVQNWTDLCIKGLTELSKTYKGPWSDPLDIPKFDMNGVKIDPPLLNGKHDPMGVSDYPTLGGIPRPSRNGKKGSGYHKLATKKARKKVDKRRKRK